MLGNKFIYAENRKKMSKNCVQIDVISFSLFDSLDNKNWKWKDGEKNVFALKLNAIQRSLLFGILK